MQVAFSLVEVIIGSGCLFIDSEFTNFVATPLIAFGVFQIFQQYAFGCACHNNPGFFTSVVSTCLLFNMFFWSIYTKSFPVPWYFRVPVVIGFCFSNALISHFIVKRASRNSVVVLMNIQIINPPELKLAKQIKVSGECPICLQNLESTEVYQTDCTHFFHLKCLNDWIKIKQDCPLCRQPIYIV